jgi:hypothetical protein
MRNLRGGSQVASPNSETVYVDSPTKTLATALFCYSSSHKNKSALKSQANSYCLGAHVLDEASGAAETIRSDRPVLATGGCGKVCHKSLPSRLLYRLAKIKYEPTYLFVTNGEDNTDYVGGPQFLYRNAGNANH